MAFLRVFGLTVGMLCLLGGVALLWVGGLMKPADILMERGHMNCATCYIAGYFIATVATVAGVVVVVP